MTKNFGDVMKHINPQMNKLDESAQDQYKENTTEDS